MRKRHWKDRKNRKCPDCNRIIFYSRKDAFDRAVGNNTVCKSCAQLDRKISLDTIEKMKQPKSVEHKQKISKSMKIHWKTNVNPIHCRKYEQNWSPPSTKILLTS